MGGLSQDLNSSKDSLRLKIKNISDERAEIHVSRQNLFSQEVGAKIEFTNGSKGEFSCYVDYRYDFEKGDAWKIASGISYRF